jgi:hypothetical protein
MPANAAIHLRLALAIVGRGILILIAPSSAASPRRFKDCVADR